MKSRIAATLVILLTVILAVLAQCRRSEARPENPEEKEARKYFAEYLRIDTSNPPGNETLGAEYLRSILEKDGIPSRLVGSDPKRQSLWARLSSGSKEPALLLLHHIDVVPANASLWSVPPFSGQRSGGYFWGRGALDIKSLGIAELMAFLDLKRSGVKLTRDVIFLAVADEEAGGKLGTRELLEQHPELFENVGYVINEGGANETVVDKITFWGIEVDEKVPLWLTLVSRGEAAHGAIPPDNGGSIVKLVAALDAVEKMPRPYRLTPTVSRYLTAVSSTKLGRKRELLEHPEQHFGSPEFERIVGPGYRSLLHDTVAFTRLAAGESPNSVPAEASATLDLRLLPDSSPDEMIQQIQSAVGPDIKVKPVLTEKPVPPSPVDTPLFHILQEQLEKSEPKSVVGPLVSPGTSDSRFFRARGIVAYGLSPFKVNYYDADTVHGVDERIRERFFDQGVGLTRRVVRAFCTETP
ncbi:MAG: M20/M25/M40 family metallo-hydrolase [Thermoanaerobaculia bacterium]